MQCDPLRGRNDTSKVRAGTMRLSPHHMTDAPCVSLLLLRRVLASRAAHRSPCLICSSRRRQAQRFSLNLCQLALRHAPPAARPAKPAAVENLSVAFSLPKYQPETVPVQIIRDPSSPGSVVVDPNPVYAELQPALPTKKGAKAAPKAKKPRPAPAAAEPAEPNSPFPPPPSR